MYQEAGMKNARLWIYVPAGSSRPDGGMVKVTIQPFCKLELSGGGPDEEGHSQWYEKWEHEGDSVTWESSSWGVDCDGRHMSQFNSRCHIDKLKERLNQFTRLFVPEWLTEAEYRRDYSAEQAGY